MGKALTTAAGIALLVMCMALSELASAAVTITPSFSPDRLNARGALTLTIHLTGDHSGVPSPARRSVVKLPAGLGLNIPTLRSCSIARLRAQGAAACPAQSQIGSGQALVQASAGSQLLTERIRLTIFLGPLHNFQPTFEVLGEGQTPLQERIVLTGTIASGGAPYGEELVMSIPAIPSLPLEPDAAVTTLTLRIGSSTNRLANTVVVPGSCSGSGFPFATEFTYADGSSDSALATAVCPH